MVTLSSMWKTTKEAGTKLMAKMMQMACSKLSLGNVIIIISIINNVTTNEAGTKLMVNMMQMACSKLSLGNVII